MQEIEIFLPYFDEISVLPFTNGGNLLPSKPLPSQVKLLKPLFNEWTIPVSAKSIFKLLDKNFLYYFKEAFRKQIWKSKKHIKYWLETSCLTQALLRHPQVIQLMESDLSDTVLYFFWAKGSCEIIPFLPKSRGKVIVRFHRYDLYEEIQHGYIPFRKQLLKHLDTAVPIAQDGVGYLRKRYPDVDFDIKLFRLGTISRGRSPKSTDNVLRIISCSLLSPVKRVEILVKALGKLQIPVHWTHLGDGSEGDKIRALVAELPDHIEVDLKGMIPSEKVLDIYVENTFDLFINVSASEGVPVSIMEAFSAGIPVLATDVGGTSEIVSEQVGGLLKANVDPDYLAQKITAFNALTDQEKQDLREQAFSLYQTTCNAEKWGHEMAQFLSGKSNIIENEIASA